MAASCGHCIPPGGELYFLTYGHLNSSAYQSTMPVEASVVTQSPPPPTFPEFVATDCSGLDSVTCRANPDCVGCLSDRTGAFECLTKVMGSDRLCPIDNPFGTCAEQRQRLVTESEYCRELNCTETVCPPTHTPPPVNEHACQDCNLNDYDCARSDSCFACFNNLASPMTWGCQARRVNSAAPYAYETCEEIHARVYPQTCLWIACSDTTNISFVYQPEFYEGPQQVTLSINGITFIPGATIDVFDLSTTAYIGRVSSSVYATWYWNGPEHVTVSGTGRREYVSSAGSLPFLVLRDA